MELNSGIQRVVAMLNAAGHKTCDSGDGETRDFDCDREGSYVVVMSTPERLVQQACEIQRLLEAQGIRVEACGSDGVHMQANYDPAMGSDFGSALIDISNIHDRMLSP